MSTQVRDCGRDCPSVIELDAIGMTYCRYIEIKISSPARVQGRRLFPQNSADSRRNRTETLLEGNNASYCHRLGVSCISVGKGSGGNNIEKRLLLKQLGRPRCFEYVHQYSKVGYIHEPLNIGSLELGGNVACPPNIQRYEAPTFRTLLY